MAVPVHRDAEQVEDYNRHGYAILAKTLVKVNSCKHQAIEARRDNPFDHGPFTPLQSYNIWRAKEEACS